jgi:NitT/TauT family transport system ATP-binding protein
MYELVNVGLQFSGRSILQGTNLRITPQRIHVLIGPSGCGKSTVLRLFAGLLRPQMGQVLGLANTDKASFVFQEPRLLNWLNVAENITLPLRLHNQPVEQKLLRDWLTNVGLANSADIFPHELSGGMKMRTAIARALITTPQLLLMDEPFAALDEIQRWHLQDLLLDIHSQRPMTILFVTHSLSEAIHLGDVVHMMAPHGGQILLSLESPLQNRRQRNLDQEQSLLQKWTAIYRQLLEKSAT